jgi:hypothetical protein
MLQFLKNVTPLQWMGVAILANGVLTGGVNELTDLFGAGITKHIVSIASLGNSFVGGLITMFSGQGAQIRNVAAMPGVESIKVNSQANTTLAQIAVSADPALAKVEPTPAADAAVTKTAAAV